MKQRDMFSGSVASRSAETAGAGDRSERTRRSALWAAYGDALGWISELTDEPGLRRRTRGAPLRRPVEWTRRIGGRAGVQVPLPQGCYSDDSQLRLATSRAIGADGFDVEAFAKVELPVWLSYALGGGKSTSAGARNLARRGMPWFANRFKGWAQSGGNGAAMRIQPHVWASPAPGAAESFLPDVVRNAICTHSHPTGIMGAVLHALAVASAAETGRLPSPDDLMAAVDAAAALPEIIRGDTEVGVYWRAAVEAETGAFDEAWARAVDTGRNAVGEAARIVGASDSQPAGANGYEALVSGLRLRDTARRGDGILTAVTAAGLGWCEPRPEEALILAANAVGTDTDTIATMAGAILGFVAEAEPPVDVLDAALFRSEADRLAEIAHGSRRTVHRYPDLLHWVAPATHGDALTRSEDGALWVRGLGRVVAQNDPVAPEKGEFQWQWVELEATGQTLLIKRRKALACREETSGATPIPSGSEASTSSPLRTGSVAEASSKSAKKSSGSASERPGAPHGLQDVLEYMQRNKDDDRLVGAAFRRVVNKGTRGEIAAFTAAMIDMLRRPADARRRGSTEADRFTLGHAHDGAPSMQDSPGLCEKPPVNEG